MLLVIAAAACDAPTYRVVVRFEPTELADSVTRVEVALVPSCTGTSSGADPIDPIREVAITRTSTSGAIGTIEPGTYGLHARGRDDGCGVIAAGCDEVRIDEGGGGDLVVTIRAIAGAGCASGETCVAGECRGPDAGGIDAGGIDAGGIDAGGIDAGPTLDGGRRDAGVECTMCDPSACPPTFCVDVACAVLGASALDMRTDHACAVAGDGSLWCWGNNAFGQLGQGAGDRSDRARPVRVGTDADWRAVGLGLDHTCAIKTDGSLHCWGRNHRGQVGTGAGATELDTPQRVGMATDWALVDASADDTCATRTSGALYCWGELAGDTPVRVGSDVMTFGMRSGHTCTVRTDGTLWCLGANANGQIGIGTTSALVSTPQQVGADADWQHVTTGGGFTCALKTDGSLWCWGENVEGQLALGDRMDRHTPTRVMDAMTEWSWVHAGEEHACGIATPGILLCWGNRADGRTGVAATEPRSLPIPVDMMLYTEVRAGQLATCAIRAGGARAVVCFGADDSGQLGDDGSIGGRSTMPVRACL